MASRLFRISKPVHWIYAALSYTLGVGIAHYLGSRIDWAIMVVGLIGVISLQAFPYFLVEYFHLPMEPRPLGETAQQREKFRVRLLQTGYSLLGFFGITILTLLFTRSLDLSTGILFGLNLILFMAYSIPPLSLAEKGYGEIIDSFVIGMLAPAIAFLLQVEKIHRLLPITTFPLMLLGLASMLAGCFPGFAADQKLGRHTLLTRLSWQRAVPIHHLLILSGFFLLAAAPFSGIPWRVIVPVFLALPFAVIQVFWLQNIANGGKTVWRFFSPLSSTVFGLVIYLLAISFWLH